MINSNDFEKNGFAEVAAEEGMATAAAYTAGCSGARSACCTRVCSADPTFVGSADAWEKFIDVQGGQIQY